MLYFISGINLSICQILKRNVHVTLAAAGLRRQRDRLVPADGREVTAAGREVPAAGRVARPAAAALAAGLQVKGKQTHFLKQGKEGTKYLIITSSFYCHTNMK